MLTFFNTILVIFWGLYLLIALLKRNWNDFLYGICIFFALYLDIPPMYSIVMIIVTVITHRYIERKEKEFKEQQEQEPNQ